MRTALILILMMTGSYLPAQFQLDADDLWKPGLEVTSIQADPNSVNEGASGSDQVWDFSAIQPSGNPSITISFHEPDGMPDADRFPTATVVEEQRIGDQALWQYWSLDSNSMQFLGTATSNFTLPYIDPETVFRFPTLFGSSQEDGFLASAESNGTRVDQVGNSINIVDGYGRVILPDATWNNVMRVVTDQSIVEQITSSSGSQTNRIRVVRFCWYAEGEPYPIVTINYTEIVSGNQVQQGKSVFYRNAQPTQPRVIQWVPHVTSNNGGFQTSFYFHNQSAQARNLILAPYAADGAPIDTKQFILQPNELRILTKNELFNTTDVSHFAMDHDPEIKVSAGYKSAGEQGASAHLHESGATGTLFRVYRGEQDVVFDGMALVNTTEQSVAVIATMKGLAGNVIATETLTADLAPAAKLLAVFDEIFPAEGEGIIEIESSGKISALFLRGSRPGTSPGYLYANLPQELTGSSRWIPHLTAPDGGFQTRLYLYNEGGSAFINLRPYSAGGGTGAVQSIRVETGELKILTPGEIFGTDAISHIEITGSSQILVSAGYRSTAAVGATAHLHETSRLDTEFYVYPGEWDLVFDGMAIVNTSNLAATVVASQIAEDGTIVASQTLTQNLAPNGKLLAVFDGLFQERAGSIIKVESSQQAVALFLRGTPVGQEPAFLYPNLPLPQ